MKLQTEIPIVVQAHQFDYDDTVLLMGSCFADHIGQQLHHYKFKAHTNPFGIIFHPVSIYQLIERATQQRLFSENDIFEKDGQWHCLEVHSLVFGSDSETYLELLNHLLAQLKDYIFTASHIVFTLGTSWVYRYKETKSIVANCHKIPQNKFDKELLSIPTIAEVLQKTIDIIGKVNPLAKIIYTVSPVRHIKDGFIESSLSKAHLLAAIHQVIRTELLVGKPQSFYFPSFEIMMDELRDYRFYSQDMLHPNTTAIAIIWEKFKQAWINPSTFDVQREVAHIQKGLQHKPFNPTSEAHITFQKKLQERIKKLQGPYPHMAF